MSKKIKILTIIAFAFICWPKLIYGQYILTIEINGLKNSKGQVLLEFGNSKGEKISGHFQEIENQKCIIVIKDLKQGNYTFKYFHDENKNAKLDTNILGIPKEGFGFSKNAKGNFGPPKLEKTIFALTENSFHTCKVTYFL